MRGLRVIGLAAVAAIVLVTIGGNIAPASSLAADPSWLCRNTTNGDLRLVFDPSECREHEQAIHYFAPVILRNITQAANTDSGTMKRGEILYYARASAGDPRRNGCVPVSIS